MSDMDQREQTMQQDVLLVAIAGASLFNGMPTSPVLFPFIVLLKPFIAGTFFESQLVLTYLASFLASATTLALAGVPAALYERVTGATRSTTVSLLIWLAGVAALVGVPLLLISR